MIQINFSRILPAFFSSCFIIIPLSIILQEYEVPEPIGQIVILVWTIYLFKWITTPPYIPDEKIDTLREIMSSVSQQLKILSRIRQNGEGDMIAQNIAALVLMKEMAHRKMQEEEYTATVEAFKKLNKDTVKYAKRNTSYIDKILKKAPLSPATDAMLALMIHGAYPDNENQPKVQEAAGFLAIMGITVAAQLLNKHEDEHCMELLGTIVHNLTIFGLYLETAAEEIRLTVKQQTEEPIQHIRKRINDFSDKHYERRPLLRTYASELLACCHHIEDMQPAPQQPEKW